MKQPPSLPQLRESLQAALIAERDSARRSDIGRALKAITSAEARILQKPPERARMPADE